MARLALASDREFSLNVSNLLTGWISYLRTDYRDSLINESHFSLTPTFCINLSGEDYAVLISQLDLNFFILCWFSIRQ
ncbi:hypothetical protein F8S12_03435 [Nostoc sp. WHI]|nr:hypothetical protein [Nostoc sp. WHI]